MSYESRKQFHSTEFSTLLHQTDLEAVIMTIYFHPLSKQREMVPRFSQRSGASVFNLIQILSGEASSQLCSQLLTFHQQPVCWRTSAAHWPLLPPAAEKRNNPLYYHETQLFVLYFCE